MILMSIYWPSGLTGVPLPYIAPGFQTHFMTVMMLVTAQEKAQIEALMMAAVAANIPIYIADRQGGWLQMRPAGVCSSQLVQTGWYRIRFDAKIYKL